MSQTLQTLLRLDNLSISKSLINRGAQTWNAWKVLTQSQDHVNQTVSIALVGKYTHLHDSYLSVIKSLEHAAMACSRKLNLIWVDAAHLETATQKTSIGEYHKAWSETCTADGILVPGGFGTRGTEGMIAAVSCASGDKETNMMTKSNISRLNMLEKKRSHIWVISKSNYPLYIHGLTSSTGICLGMQIAVIEYARHICGIPSATSYEIDKNSKDPVIIYMPEIDQENLGGTMRLGLRPTHFQPGSEWSKLRALYGEDITLVSTDRLSLSNGSTAAPNGTTSLLTSNTTANGPTTVIPPSCSDPLIIQERHRHRYEVNPAYVDTLTEHGLSFVGKDDLGERMEIMELKGHPWYVGVQYHPEYLSRVLRPSKPYLGFVAAASQCLKEMTASGGRMRGSSVNGLMSPEMLANGGLDGVRI